MDLLKIMMHLSVVHQMMIHARSLAHRDPQRSMILHHLSLHSIVICKDGEVDQPPPVALIVVAPTALSWGGWGGEGEGGKGGR